MTVMTAPHLGATTGQRRVDAVSLLSCYLLLLMAIPSFLVVGAVGRSLDVCRGAIVRRSQGCHVWSTMSETRALHSSVSIAAACAG